VVPIPAAHRLIAQIMKQFILDGHDVSIAKADIVSAAVALMHGADYVVQAVPRPVRPTAVLLVKKPRP